MDPVQGTLQFENMEDIQPSGEDHVQALKIQPRMIGEVHRGNEAPEAARKEIEELKVKLGLAYDQNLKLQKELDEVNGLLVERNKQLEESEEKYLQQAMRGDALDVRIGFLNFTIKQLQNKLNGTEEGVMYVPARDGDNKQNTSAHSTSGIHKIVCTGFNFEDVLKRRYAEMDADSDEEGLD